MSEDEPGDGGEGVGPGEQVARGPAGGADRLERDPFTPIGTSPALRRALELARRVAPTDAPVLITGESGTGKEMVAHLIHRLSRRRDAPMLPVHCAVLPPDIAEGEIFGEPAAHGDPGLLERAHRGTLLLDDVDHLPPPVQLRLVRVIERRAALGAGRAQEEGANVRFMATLAVAGARAVEAKRLRMDLFYRLAVFPIHLPPLRERVEDIPLLAHHFLAHFWRLDRRGSGNLPRLSRRAVAELQARRWPGNVRELQNVMERAVVVLEPGQQVRPGDLPETPPPAPPPDDEVIRPPHRRERNAAGRVAAGDATGTAGALEPAEFVPGGSLLDQPYAQAKSRMTEEFERSYLTRLIRRTGGNMQAAAQLGGVNKTTLYRLLHKYELRKEDVLKD
jgi:DNA-binding NtrC family response regulator